MSKGGTEQRETADQRELARVASARWNLYQQYFVPMENQAIEMASQMQDPGAYNAAQGVVNAATIDRLSDIEGKVTADSIARGANPNSGAFQSPALAKARARGRGAAAASAVTGQTDRAYAARLGIVAQGEGQASDAMTGLNDLAEVSARRAASIAQTNSDINMSRLGLIGSVAGAGTRAYLGEDMDGKG